MDQYQETTGGTSGVDIEAMIKQQLEEDKGQLQIDVEQEIEEFG
jgi:hypothetical protein